MFINKIPFFFNSVQFYNFCKLLGQGSRIHTAKQKQTVKKRGKGEPNHQGWYAKWKLSWTI